MTAYRPNRFRSRNDGLNRRKGSRLEHNGRLVYFPSKAEATRAAELIMQERIGKIERLRFHPRFDLKVEGTKVTTYVADALYLRDGRQVIEDVKPAEFQTDASKLKIALFNALNQKHGLTVQIIRR